jgi:hypothetical protein
MDSSEFREDGRMVLKGLEGAVGWEKERLASIPDVDVIEGKVPCLSHRARSGSNTRYKDPRHGGLPLGIHPQREKLILPIYESKPPGQLAIDPFFYDQGIWALT